MVAIVSNVVMRDASQSVRSRGVQDARRRNWMLADGGQHPLCLMTLGSHVKVTGLTGKVASSEKASRGADTPRKCQIEARFMKLREIY